MKNPEVLRNERVTTPKIHPSSSIFCIKAWARGREARLRCRPALSVHGCSCGPRARIGRSLVVIVILDVVAALSKRSGGKQSIQRPLYSRTLPPVPSLFGCRSWRWPGGSSKHGGGRGRGGARISPSEALCNCSLNVPSLEDDEREDEEEDEEERGLWIAGGSNGKSSSVPLNKEVASAAAEALARELESKVDFSVSGSLAAPPCSSAKPLEEGAKSLEELILVDPIWAAMRAEARLEAEKEPLLSSFLYASILSHSCFERALGFVLANRLQNPTLLASQLMDIFDDVMIHDAGIRRAIQLDVQAVKGRDPSCRSYSWALLYLKGYHSLQSYRVAHALWARGQNVLALALQSRISKVFGVDIHPATKIGKGVLLDHATGVVIGETAVVGNRASIMQGVTLGGTGREIGDRHPKIGHGSLIGASATILGNIKVGNCAVVTAGSLVLKDVPAYRACVVVRIVGWLWSLT